MLGKPRILSLFPVSLINSIKHEHSCKILMYMFRICSNHRLQTNPWHRMEELQNINSHTIFARILFSRIVIKDIFATLKIRE